jgi:predicted GIY-YIG superfamily endonuclease
VKRRAAKLAGLFCKQAEIGSRVVAFHAHHATIKTMTTIAHKTSDFVLVNPQTINISIDPTTPVTSNIYDRPRNHWLYALKLEDDKYYVGFTAHKNPYDRIMQHVEGNGAQWTKVHKPLEVIEIRDAGMTTQSEVKALEHSLAGTYMDLFGANNVRGGIFNDTSRLFRIGNSIIYEQAFYGLIAGLLFGVAYILARHQYNWW